MIFIIFLKISEKQEIRIDIIIIEKLFHLMIFNEVSS
jgi:hypothetical protein